MLNFTKMNGAGNDFVLLDNRDGKLALEKAAIARLCDRHRGVGGEAEMCGNGARCFARFAQKISGRTGDVSFETLAGVISAKFIDRNVRIQMSEPHSLVLHASIP